MQTKNATPGSVGTLQRLSDWLADRLVVYRKAVFIIVAAVTIWFGYEATLLRFDAGFEKSIPNSHPYMQTYHKYQDIFGGANVVIVALRQKQGSAIEGEFLLRLGRATQKFLDIDGIKPATAKSLFTPNVKFMSIDEEGFVSGPIVPGIFDGSPEQVAVIKANLAKSSEIGHLISYDGKGALIIGEIEEYHAATGKKVDYVKLSNDLEILRDEFSDDGVEVAIIGFPRFIGDIIASASGVIVLFCVTLVLTVIALYLYVGSLWLVFSVMVAALSAVIWQLGIVKLLGYGLDPMSILVPFLVLAIAVSHAVQMANVWKREVAEGAEGADASRAAFSKLFIPGLTALLSTAAGFAAIMVIDIDIIHELAIIASVGMAVMTITNKFFLPSILSFVKLSPATLDRFVTAAKRQDRHWFWWFCSGATLRLYSIPILLLAGVAVVVGWEGRQNLVVGDTDAGAPEFWPEARYNRDVATIVSNFNVGLDELTVVAETPADGCLDFRIMDHIDQFVWRMQNVEGVQSVTTLATALKARNVANHEGNPEFYTLTRLPGNTATNMYNFDLHEKLFDETCSAMPIRIFSENHRAGTLREIIGAGKEFSEKFPVDYLKYSFVGGDAGIFAATNAAVEAAQLQMVLTIFSCVILLGFATFYSWRIVACIVLPLAVVSLLGDAVMGWLNIGLKVSTLPVIALGVGVGVDYGIYLFARTKEYLERGFSLRVAYYEALCRTGTAVVFTAVTMAAGVATWAWSDLKFQADMGLLLAYMFVVNMIGAIVLMPALAHWLVRSGAGRVDTAPA